MKKTISISIVSFLLISSVCIAYYFLIFLPNFKQQELNKSNAEELLKKQIECQKNGLALHEKDLGNMEGALVPNFKFNEKLKTCLYKGGWTSSDAKAGFSISWFIKDVYTNKEIISYTSFTKDGKTEDLLIGGLVSREEFEQKEKELFGE